MTKFIIVPFAMALIYSGCNSKEPVRFGRSNGVAGTISLSATTASLSPGEKLTVTATALDGDGSPVTTSVGGKDIVFSWGDCDENVASVSSDAASATITANGEGSCTLSVEAISFGTAEIEVSVGAAVDSMTLAPVSTTGQVGGTIDFTATATLRNGSTKDVTSSAAWSSSPEGAVTFSDSPAGRATINESGTITVSATYAGTSGTATLTALDDALATIVIVSGSQPNLQGVAQQLQAIGIYEDGSTEDITTSATWTSSNTAKATINNSTSKGLATLLASGATTITATMDGVSATMTLTVGAATLSSIAITPAAIPIAAGYSHQLSVTGTYSDSTKLNLTSAASWTSSDATKATASNTSPTKGKVTGVAAGSATIIATVLGLSTTAVVNTTTATLSSMDLTPSSATLPVNAITQLTAEGTFSDTSSLDLTKSATWSSSSASVTVGNDVSTKGLLTAVQSGAATITAALNAVSNTAAITASAATLSSITISPASVSINARDQRQFSAVGTYSDASTHDLTTVVEWTSSNKAAAVVSNFSSTKGLVTGLAVGTATITAALDGVSATASVTVTTGATATISSIEVTPATTSISGTSTQQFVATAIFSDGTTQVVTGSSAWTSSATGVATINASTGLLTGVASGTTIISATKSSVTGFARATVTLDQAAPPSPTGLAGTAVASDSITFSWTSGGGSTASYKYAYQSGSSAPADCDSGTTGTTAASSVTLTGLAASTEYTMIVCAINADTTPELSAASADASMFTKPATPTNFAAVSSTTQIDLSWDNMAGDDSGYKIAYKSGAVAPSTCNSDTTTTAAANATSKSITGLTPATQYTFIICTVNSASGQSLASAGISQTTDTAPVTPTSFTATASTTLTTTIALAWDNMAGDAGGYKIAYKSGTAAPADCDSDTTTTAAANATNKSIATLSAATQYTFIICTVNASGTYSTAASSATATTIPTTTTTFAATAASDTQIDLSWDNMADDSNGYKIAYQSGSSAPATCSSGTTTTAAANATTKSITGLSSATQYTFIICTSHSTAGDAVPATAVRAYTKPVTPTGLAVTTTSTSQLDLTWDNMAGDTNGYKIAYQSGSSAPASCSAGTTTTAAANATSKAITGLAAGTQYSFLICTSNTLAGDSVASSGESKYTTPAAPSITATADSSTQITLSWAAVTGDTGGYKIAYASGATAPATCASGTTTTAAAAANSKAITGLSPNTQYTFIACTVNSDSGDSAASTADDATTTASAPTTTPYTQGPWGGFTFANDSSYGFNNAYAEWTNASNVDASDNTYTTAEAYGTEVTQYFKASNFAFSLPSGATITGISVAVERKVTASGMNSGSESARDSRVRIVKGGAVGTTDKSSATDWPSADGTITYGGSSDLWGETWTAADINASDFGFVISGGLINGTGMSGFIFAIDYVTITVDYTLSGTFAGPYTATSYVGNDATVGTVAWSGVNQTRVSDNTDISASMNTSEVTNYLKLTDFRSTGGNSAFAIPGGATINGILVTIERARNNAMNGAALMDNSIKLVKAGTIQGSDKANTTAYWPYFDDRIVSYGGPSDLWGSAWTPTDINDAAFGVAYSAKENGSNNADPTIDQVTITVFYTE